MAASEITGGEWDKPFLFFLNKSKAAITKLAYFLSRIIESLKIHFTLIDRASS